MLGGTCAVVVTVDSKPPASPPEVSWLDHSLDTFHTCTHSSSRVIGKAPRKQLATKAARKTAVVSVASPF
jgi:hypothetical protein